MTATANRTTTLKWADINVGDEVTTMEIPITDFELSVRSRNCLKKINVRTLGDLTRVSEQQLLSSKNFGETSLGEIKEMMAAKGLHLGQSIQEGGQSDMRYRPSTPVSEEQAAVMNKPVSDLNLSVRARKCMTKLGIQTVGELLIHTGDELEALGDQRGSVH